MKKYLLVIFISFYILNLSYGKKPDIAPSKVIRIDTITILKNWRTKDAIIKQELNFDQGDVVTIGRIDSCIIKVWNIGNFTKVNYTIDTLVDGRNHLTITARDAFTIIPILSFSGSRKDWRLSAGISDNNFLGRNIGFDIQGTIGTLDKNFSLNFRIPRQLLYKNMSVSGGVLIGQGSNYAYENGEQVSAIAYHRKEIYSSISNPWNEDFKYRFSPNFNWRLFQHITDTSLTNSEAPFVEDYDARYLAISVSESVGFIQRKNHQKQGYSLHGGIGTGIGLNNESPHYISMGVGAEYHKLFNDIIQWSASINTSYTTAELPSLIHYLGGGSVRGILTGEIYGKAVYSGRTGLYFTYLNRDWFAVTQSVYFNMGNGSMKYFDLYKSKPLASIGTGFKFWTPTIPWLSISFYFTYSKNKTNWFQMSF